MPRIQFTKDVAGTLVFYAPEGIPDGAASLTIYTSGDATLTGETWPYSATLTSASTTLSAAASRYAENISATDGSAFVARTQRYMISDGGQIQEITISRKSSNTLYLDQPLAAAVANGATLASHRYTYSLSTTQTATLRRRLRAVWSYAVGGVSYSHTQYFSIVREPFDIYLTEEDIEEHDLEFGQYVDDSGAWRKLIEGAHNDVERMLRAKQLSPDLIRDRDALRDAVIFGVLSKIYQKQPERAAAWGAKVEQAITNAIDARTWYDADDDHDGGDEQSNVIYDTSGNALGTLDSEGRLEPVDELGVPVKYARVG